MHNKLHNLSEAIHESQIMFAVIFGMFVQFFLGSTKTFKIASAIVVSSIFVAMYVVSPIIEVANISEDSKLAISLYALSSLISMELIAVLLTVLPNAIKDRLLKYLEFKNVDKK